MFDHLKAYRHAGSLAFPRAAGTAGEEKARAYLIQTLQNTGVETSSQFFTFSKLPDLLLRVTPFLYGIALWIISIGFSGPSWTAIAVLCGVIGSGIVINSLQYLFTKLHNVCGYLKSENVIGQIPAQSYTKQRVIFMAHYDSKSQVLPIAIRVVCFFGLIIAAVLLLVSNVVGFFMEDFPFRIFSQPCGYVSVVCGLALLVNFTRNRSPGAADNASGVAILLELARLFIEKPLQHIQLTFLFTGAEEYGMAGAFRFCEKQSGTVSQTLCINIDGAGKNAPVGMIAPRGTISSRAGGTLVKGIAATAWELSLPFARMRSLLGAGFDHVPAVACGYEAITLYSRSLRMLFRVHSGRDTIDKVSSDALEGIGKLCESYIRKLDKKVNP